MIKKKVLKKKANCQYNKKAVKDNASNKIFKIYFNNNLAYLMIIQMNMNLKYL